MQVCWDADPVTGYVYTCKANYNASFISYSFCEGCSADVTWDIKCVTLGIHQTTNCSWDFPCDTANNCQIRCPLTGAAWAGLVVTCGSCP